MAYRFKHSDASVGDGVRRIAREEIEAILGILEGSDTASIVHQVRRRCKRLRGLVRLVAPMLKKARKEDRAVRDAARLLSGSRDADVLGETLAGLAERGGALTAEQAGQLAERLRRRQAVQPPDLARFRTDIVEVHVRAGGWTIGADGFDALAEGFRQTYKAAREGMAEALRSRDAAALHEWRKQVKYHWHHLGLLREIAPEAIEARREAASALATVLGDHHNLHVLCGQIEARFADLADAGAAGALGAARGRQAELEAEAARLGDTVLAAKPKALTAWAEEHWRAWSS